MSMSFRWTSRSQEETPNPLTLRRTRALTSMKKRRNIKESLAEYSTGTASEDQERPPSQRGEAISLPMIVHCSSDSSLTARPRVPSRRQPGSLAHDVGVDVGKRQFPSKQSERERNVELKLKMTQGFGRKVKHGELWAGINVAEVHERKLEKELKKQSDQHWPSSRERLAVFSDVFDDVCEGSPVFGRILREIKTDYDLYVNHMMSSASSLLSVSDETSLRDPSNVQVRERELEDAEKEVRTLEEEVRRALEENKRLQDELQNVPALMGPEDRDLKNASVAIDGAGSVKSKRLQVLNTRREIQQLEEEVEQKLVSTATTTATERRIKDAKTDTMRLIASNERLRTTNKNMENHINKLLDREKASKALRRMLWDEIHGDLRTECEQLHEQVNQRATV